MHEKIFNMGIKMVIGQDYFFYDMWNTLLP